MCKSKTLNFIIIFLIIIHIIFILILCIVPEVSRDALNHHLAVPKIYLRDGAIHELPSMHFSYFPMNIELLYIIPLFFNFDIAAKYIHFSFSILTSLIIFRYVKQKFGKTLGLIGVLLFITTPIIVRLSITSYVDLGLIFFSWTSIYFLLKWIDTNFEIKFLLLSGIMCGLALGTKYNALITLFIITGFIPIIYSHYKNLISKKNAKNFKNINSLHGLINALIFATIAIAFFSPWMIRNIAWKNNPLYPLYENVFNPNIIKNLSNSPETKKEQYPNSAFEARRFLYNESLLETITIPLRSFIQGQDDNPKYFDGKLNPYLLFFIIFSLIIPNKKSNNINFHGGILGFFSLIYIFTVLFQTDFRIRYITPALPPIIILCVHGLKSLYEPQATFNRLANISKKIATITLLCLAFFYNINYLNEQFKIFEPILYITGKIDKNSYISFFQPEHQAILFANKTLPYNAEVLCLCIGDRTYYLNRSSHLAEDFFDKLHGEFTENDILNKLTKNSTTHIIINWDTFSSWLERIPINDRIKFTNILETHTNVIFQSNGVRILEFK